MFSKLLFAKFIGLFSGTVASTTRSDGVNSAQAQVRVLFVCMGNICRSPTARGVFEKLVRDAGLTHAIQVDSAGTYANRAGEPPDRRAVAAASKRGYDLGRQRARRLDVTDLEEFDYLLAMDYENLNDMQQMLTPGGDDKLKLLMDFAHSAGQPEVPDPYYGGGGGFERVLDLVEEAARGLLVHIRAEHRL